MPVDDKSFMPKQPPAGVPDPAVSEDLPARLTFLMPFIFFCLLGLPTMAVLALTKDSVGFRVFTDLGYFGLVNALLWVDVILTVLSGIAYLIRGKGIAGKVIVALGVMASLTCFVIVMRP